MKTDFRSTRLLPLTLVMIYVTVTSCTVEPEPEKNITNNGSNGTPGKTFTPDEVANYLVLKNATKISGAIPQASGGNAQINSKDTIYLVKDVPFGKRIEVKHDGSPEITGFYVSVLNSSFYFDAPAVQEESQETTDVFFLYLEDPDGMVFPFSFPVVILPHVNGIPVKKFIRVITIEDPKAEEVCSPLGPAPSCFEDSVTGETVCQCATVCWYWIWEFTVVEDNTGDIHAAYAPGMFINNPLFTHGGCCWLGISIPAKHDPYCVPANPEYQSVVVDDVYYVRYFEALDLFDNGMYERYTYSETKNYSPDETNYCSGEVGYLVDRGASEESGLHNFSKTSDRISFTSTWSRNPDDPTLPGESWSIASGNLVYTCNNLIISFPYNGGKWSVVYRRSAVDFNPLESYFPEYYE